MRKKSLNLVTSRPDRVTRTVLESGDFQMLSLVATRLHNEFCLVDKAISFIVTGNHSGSVLEVHVMNNEQLVEFIKHWAGKYMEELRPYFEKGDKND